VKMDDVGLHLAKTRTGGLARFGERMVAAMPKGLAGLSTVGMAAMSRRGGHILLVGADDLGWHWPYGVVHDAEHWVREHVSFLTSVLAWLTNTLCSAVVGLIVGGIIAAVVIQIHKRQHGGDHDEAATAH